MRRLLEILFVLAAATVVVASPGRGAELYVGVAEADITHAQPMALWGQMHARISTSVESPVTAHVVALESREGDRGLDAAIMVSADIIGLPHDVLDGLRKRVAERLPDFDVQKLFVSGTHTHTGPVFEEGTYSIPKEGVVQPTEYAQFFVDRVSEAVARAWQDRKPGAVAWGLGHAVVGQNRRAVYADGRAVMYGRTNQPDFRGIEGYEDHAVHILCFYDAQKRLKAAAITLATTAQAEGGAKVSADFWHDVRRLIHERHGAEVSVLGFCAPAGDQTPRAQVRRKSEMRMCEFRGLTYNQEIGRRVASAFEDVAGVIAKDIRADVPLVHRVVPLELPARIVTEAEYAVAKKVCEDIDAKQTPAKSDHWTRTLYRSVADRYLAQQKGEAKTYEMELHVLRLGDVAIATNPFELFLDYGVQIEARSPALQTFLIQLAGAGRQHAYYLATPRAMAGGELNDKPFTNYSATVMTNMVGPEGGQVLVDRTVETIQELWKN